MAEAELITHRLDVLAAVNTGFQIQFDSSDGAQVACDQLDRARSEGLVKVIDRAVLEWPNGAAKPALRHTREDEWRSSGWGAFWGLLVGTLFFVPLLGVAAGAGAGALHQHLQGVGLTTEQLESIRAQTIAFDDFIAFKGEQGAKDAGKMRAEGKEYVVKDGDVLNFLFNV